MLLVATLFCVSCATTPDSTPDEISAQEFETLLATGSVDELYGRANAYFDSHDYVSAFRAYQAVLDRDARHLGALVNSGVCARRLGDAQGAIAWYDRALEVEPNDVTALQNRILAAVPLGQIRESLPFATHLAHLAPGDPDHWRQLGGLQMQLAQFSDAVISFEKLVSLDVDNPINSYHLGLAYAQNREFEAASDSFTRAVNLNPDLREAYSPQVQMFTLLGRYDDAWAWVSEGQTRGAMFDPDLILELQRLSGQVGPR